VPELFRQAGLTDVEVEGRAPLYPAGDTRWTARIDLIRSIRPHVLAMGLASEAQLDELDAAARAHLNEPSTVVISGLLFLAWGRKPVWLAIISYGSAINNRVFVVSGSADLSHGRLRLHPARPAFRLVIAMA
jgi:hypothetical protein